MILIDKKDQNKVLTFVPLIKVDYSQWHIVSLRFESESDEETNEILQRFVKINEDKEGFCLLESPGKALSILKLGTVDNYNAVKNDIEGKLDGKKCRVLAKKMSANGIKQIQINLTADKSSDKNEFLVLAREDREKNVILTIDDDLFVRKTLVSLLSENAEVHEVEDGASALEVYKQYNPDVVILDIHMPGVNGLALLQDILDVDPDAYVVMSSSDSVKENVVTAMKRGAVGFLVKPIQKEKIENYLSQCITYTQKTKESYELDKNFK